MDAGGINSTTAAVVAPADESSKDETMSPDTDDSVFGNIGIVGGTGGTNTEM